MINNSNEKPFYKHLIFWIFSIILLLTLMITNIKKEESFINEPTEIELNKEKNKIHEIGYQIQTQELVLRVNQLKFFKQSQNKLSIAVQIEIHNNTKNKINIKPENFKLITNDRKINLNSTCGDKYIDSELLKTTILESNAMLLNWLVGVINKNNNKLQLLYTNGNDKAIVNLKQKRQR